MIPAARLMANDTALTAPDPALRDAFVAIWAQMQWRETYKGTDIGETFMSRFGCYEFIGVDAPYRSAMLRGFVVYMPAGLYYPWHHHPAEEIYVVLAGAAEFEAVGSPAKMLRPGQTSYHAANQPHRTTTHDQPLLAWVAWRTEFDTAPVLTPPGMITNADTAG